MKISVCIATYNGSQYIAEQLLSIVSQLQEGDEVLVADDGSTDDTADIAREFDKYVRVLSTERVGGVVANFERLLVAARGQAIALCDQDDVWLPGRVELIRKHLGYADLIVLNGRVTDALLKPRKESIFDLVSVLPGFWRNLARNRFVGCCMAFRSSLRDRVIPFPSKVPWHDWYIGLVASLVGNVEYIAQETMLFRRHSSNASATGMKSRNSRWQMLLMRMCVLRAVLIAVLRRKSVPIYVG